MATRAAVVIPWRETPDRRDAFAYVWRFWRDLDLEVRVFDSDYSRPFNCAEARNRGVRWAQAGGYDVAIVCDADTFGDAAVIRHAVDAAQGGAVVLPYTEYRTLGPLGTLALRRGRPPADCHHTALGPAIACSGIYVTTPETWFSIGGMDERFTVWAPEDWAFRLAHQTLLGEQVRLDGHVYALHHDDPPSKAAGPEYDACVALYQRYLEANGNPAAMRELVDGGMGHAVATTAGGLGQAPSHRAQA